MIKMSNHKIDLTKWSGVTFLNNSLKMDVFLVNGAPMAMSSRPLGPVAKQSMLQRPVNKPPPKLKPMPKRKKVPVPVAAASNNSSLLVKLPSIESGEDYKSSSPSSTSSSSHSSSATSESLSGGEDDELEEDEEVLQSSASEEPEEDEAENSQKVEAADDKEPQEEKEENFSGANSPWFEQQDHDDLRPETEAKTSTPVFGTAGSEPQLPTEMSIIETAPAQLPPRKTPETMVQLMHEDIDDTDDKNDSLSQAEHVDEIENEAEANESFVEENKEDLAGRKDSSTTELTEDKEVDVEKETGILASAIAGNKKRLAKILESNDFYDSYLRQDQADNKESSRPATSTSFFQSQPPETEAATATQGSYNDILNVLEKMENEMPEEDNDSGRAQSVSSTSGSASYTKGSPKRTPSRNATSRNEGSKLNDLMNYLEEVENDREQNSNGTTTVNGEPPRLNRSPVNSKIADLVCESPKKLAEQVVNLQFVVEEKERAIEVVRAALEHQRKLSANFSQKFQRELNQRLGQQKSEYEAAIHRHQNFIDQLIEDKKGLSERCDCLTLELSNAERKFQETLKSQEQRHTQEIRRLKSLQETSNKLKQEKWVDEKTRRIKEQTVRGLEPEIQRLLARHNAELADLEAERERRLSAQERELHQRHLQHIRELRSQWEEENAEGWVQERTLLAQRHSQQLEELTSQHQDELERAQEQLRRERQRCQDDRAHYENEANQIRRIAHERAQAEIERIREDEENKRRVLMKKHANEMTAFKEVEAEERTSWERKCRQKMDEEWKQQEEGLRERFRKERDAELDRVVHKLEAEVITGRKNMETEFHERMNRTRAKYESEIGELTRELEAMRDKWTKSRDEAAKKEEELIVVKAMLKQKEVALDQASETIAKFEAEREDVRQAVRGEFSVAMDSLTAERGALMNQLSDVRLKLAEAQSEREAAEKSWKAQADEEASKIHARVRAAIAKKDENICELQRSYDQALSECQHLETLLQRQTKQNYLGTTQGGAKSKPGRK